MENEEIKIEDYPTCMDVINTSEMDELTYFNYKQYIEYVRNER